MIRARAASADPARAACPEPPTSVAFSAGTSAVRIISASRPYRTWIRARCSSLGVITTSAVVIMRCSAARKSGVSLLNPAREAASTGTTSRWSYTVRMPSAAGPPGQREQQVRRVADLQHAPGAARGAQRTPCRLGRRRGRPQPLGGGGERALALERAEADDVDAVDPLRPGPASADRRADHRHPRAVVSQRKGLRPGALVVGHRQIQQYQDSMRCSDTFRHGFPTPCGGATQRIRKLTL